MNNNCCDMYVLFTCVFEGDIAQIKSEPLNDTAATFIEILERQSKYECASNICDKLERIFLGEFNFACLGDNYNNINENLTCTAVTAFEKVQLFLTKHPETELGILTIIIPQVNNDVTAIEDQISTDNIYLANSDTYQLLDKFLGCKYGIRKIGIPKTVICLSKKPEDLREFQCMLAGEAFNSQYVNYKLKSSEIEDIANKNIAQYDFYEAYVSSECLVYILKDLSVDFKENLESEVAIIFICELILFQHAAISRANENIVSKLTNSKKISLKNIEEFYLEFGKTIVFWNTNNFKYILPQNLSNAILKAFKTPELLDSYYRNQAHLEHIVELRNSQSAEREGKVINAIAILLAVIQIIPIMIEFCAAFFQNTSNLLPLALTATSTFFTVFLLLIIARKMNSRRKKRRYTK